MMRRKTGNPHQRAKRPISRAVRAFTIIEVLLVMAIIAILVAVAIPNLIHAQMRAKVSRAKTDLRTLASALEAYAVDYHAYPEPISYTEPAYQHRLLALTTPVAYMPGLLVDVFVEENYQSAGVPRVHHYDYNHRETGIRINRTLSEWRKAFGDSVWKIASSGPDESFLPPYGDYGFETLYDPTNGTNSAGDIVRIQALSHRPPLAGAK